MSVAGYNPFGTEEETSTGMEVGGSPYGEVAEEVDMELDGELTGLANSMGMSQEMGALADGDSSAIVTRLAQELTRATDIVNRAMSLNIEQQVDLGAIERAANSNPPDPVALANALKEVDNANQVEARVVNQELSQGIVGGSAAIAGLGQAAAVIGGIAGADSVDPRIKALGDEIKTASPGMQTIAKEMNTLETSADGGAISSAERTVAVKDVQSEELMGLQPLNTPGMGDRGVSQGIG